MNKLLPTPTRAPTTSKIGPVSIDRVRAQAPEPAATTGDAEHRTFVDTFFTKVPVNGEEPLIIYNGDQLWAKITLTLETAGPVAVGNQSSLAPVLSGKGQLLETDVPAVFFIAKGTRLYVAAAGINRIKRVVEPIPWLETLAGLLRAIATGVGGTPAALAGMVAKVRSKF